VTSYERISMLSYLFSNFEAKSMTYVTTLVNNLTFMANMRSIIDEIWSWLVQGWRAEDSPLLGERLLSQIW
jgi:hypothetical protein